MTATVTIDKAGRVVIPKEIRDELRLEAGDALAVVSEGEGVILRPVHGGTPLQKERGVWVFHDGKPLSLDEANQLVRDARRRRGPSIPRTHRTSRGSVRKSPAA
jgi:AbrB family looped-hinge helix DNA binding protein